MSPQGEDPPTLAVPPTEDAEDLYEHAPCGYLSTLPDGTIIRLNQTLLEWTGYRREDLVGRRRFSDILTPGGRIYVETHFAPLLTMQDAVREIALDVVRADGTRLPALINAILVRDADGNPSVIRTSVFDATDRREYERELLRARERAERSEAHARVLAQTLQASLIPPEPPAVPGMDVGAGYRPAGSGDEVGGDFYDVFDTGQGDWAVVIGDVCGKGAAAAAVTALARHTLRAAAMRTRRPSDVLAQLNDALLLGEEGHFCTVLYLRLRGGMPGDAVEVTIASGGHPLPILVSDEQVVPVGRPGTLLGVLADPVLPETRIQLQPGASLLGYTDGLTEGRRGREFYGEDRLLALLRAHRGKGAADLVTTVMDAVVDFQHGTPRDDMAAVAVRTGR